MTGIAPLPQALLDLVAGKRVVIYDEERFGDLIEARLAPLPDTVAVRINAMSPKSGYLTVHYAAGDETETFVPQIEKAPPTDAARAACDAAMASRDLRPLIDHIHRGSPTGLHAWENVLRINPIAFEDPPSDALIQALAGQVRRHDAVTDIVLELARVLRPSITFSGHDCYISSTVKNAFLLAESPSWTIYKYLFNPVYFGPDLGYVRDGGVTFSRRYTAMRDHAAKPVWETHAERARRKLDRIVTDYGQLSYMDVAEREFSYETATGEPELRALDHAGALLAPPGDAPLEAGQPVFVLAMHSFADETMLYGLDMFRDMFDYFSSVTRAIRETAPEARIAVRFHPNTLEKNLHPVEERDCDLQRELYRKLRSEHGSILVSNVHRRLTDFDPAHPVIPVTRWGTIGLECMHLGLPLLCTRLAPYADFVPSDLVISDRSSIPARILSALDAVWRGARPDYHMENVYRLAASMFFQTTGEPRWPHMARSPEGIAFFLAHGQGIHPRARKTDDIDDMRARLGDAAYRDHTTATFAAFLRDTAETDGDRIFLQQRLNW